jgi:hypothetical protein
MEESNSSPPQAEENVYVSPADFGSPGDAFASEGCYGITDILKVVDIFEKAGITCCMAGISALKWFGAGRVRWACYTGVV